MEQILTTILWLAVGFGCGWLAAKARSLDDYNAMYSHLTAEIISSMTVAMRSIGMTQFQIDLVVQRMGQKVMPCDAPPPPPPVEQKAKSDEELLDEELAARNISFGYHWTVDLGDIPLIKQLILNNADELRKCFDVGDKAGLETVAWRIGKKWTEHTKHDYKEYCPNVEIRPDRFDGLIIVTCDAERRYETAPQCDNRQD